MAEVSPVVFEFHARTTKFRSDVRGTTNVVGSDLDRMEARFRANADRISSTMRGLGATLATALGAREISGLLDSYTRFQNALKVAGLEGETLAGVQERLFTLANRNGVALEAIGTLYGRAAQSADTLGASQEDLLKFTEAVSASLRITGTSTQEASGSLLQLGQALGSPRVQANGRAPGTIRLNPSGDLPPRAGKHLHRPRRCESPSLASASVPTVAPAALRGGVTPK